MDYTYRRTPPRRTASAFHSSSPSRYLHHSYDRYSERFPKHTSQTKNDRHATTSAVLLATEEKLLHAAEHLAHKESEAEDMRMQAKRLENENARLRDDLSKAKVSYTMCAAKADDVAHARNYFEKTAEDAVSKLQACMEELRRSQAKCVSMAKELQKLESKDANTEALRRRLDDLLETHIRVSSDCEKYRTMHAEERAEREAVSRNAAASKSEVYELQKELSSARDLIAKTALKLNVKEEKLHQANASLQAAQQAGAVMKEELDDARKRLADALTESRDAATLRVKNESLRVDAADLERLKSFYEDHRPRTCAKCGASFTKASNSDTACASHTGNYITDQFYSTSPSIGTWSCCGKHSRNAPPCFLHGPHKE